MTRRISEKTARGSGMWWTIEFEIVVANLPSAQGIAFASTFSSVMCSWRRARATFSFARASMCSARSTATKV